MGQQMQAMLEKFNEIDKSFLIVIKTSKEHKTLRSISLLILN